MHSLVYDVLPLEDGSLRRNHGDVLGLGNSLGRRLARLGVVRTVLDGLLVSTLEEEDLSLTLLSRDELCSGEVGAEESDCAVKTASVVSSFGVVL